MPRAYTPSSAISLILPGPVWPRWRPGAASLSPCAVLKSKDAIRRWQTRPSPARLPGTIARHIRQLDRDITAIETAIAKAIADHPLWKKLHTALLAVPGIGDRTATAIIAHMPELGRLNRREAAAMAGLAPINRDSGSSRGRRFVQGGRQVLKTALYMAALSAAKHHPSLKQAYTNMKRAGKPPKVALIAIARKLLIIANSIAKQIISPA